LASLKLKENNGMFKKVYEEMGSRFTMSAKLREYSFMNRWFIFRRRTYGPLSAALVGEAGEAIAAPVQIVLPVLPASVAAEAMAAATATRGRGRGRGRGGATRGRGGRGGAGGV